MKALSLKKLTKKYPYYVTMTDRFMSGWGKSKGKDNKVVIGVNSYAEAKTVQRNAKDRGEMKYVNIVVHKPSYDKRNILTSWGNKSSFKTWFRKDRPFKPKPKKKRRR